VVRNAVAAQMNVLHGMNVMVVVAVVVQMKADYF
jgi:hypothetical protein